MGSRLAYNLKLAKVLINSRNKKIFLFFCKVNSLLLILSFVEGKV